MTLADAFSLAMALHSLADVRLIAIGHFIPVEQIEPDSPWKLSVEYRGERHVITSGVHWDQIYRPGRNKSPPAKPTPSDAEDQLTLF